MTVIKTLDELRDKARLTGPEISAEWGDGRLHEGSLPEEWVSRAATDKAIAVMMEEFKPVVVKLHQIAFAVESDTQPVQVLIRKWALEGLDLDIARIALQEEIDHD